MRRSGIRGIFNQAIPDFIPFHLGFACFPNEINYLHLVRCSKEWTDFYL